MAIKKSPSKNTPNASAPRRPSSENAKTTVVVKQAIVNVFFDGTLNNYYNANKRNDNTSYGNDLSNVARMWVPIRNEKSKCAIYIDGMGTTRFQNDTTDGYAYGDGDTGVMARADSAFAQIHQKVWDANGQTIPPVVRINVYGFSRGAATARTFVHWFNTERQQRFKDNADKWQGVNAQVNFVGLFDTVSSYAPKEDRDSLTSKVPKKGAFDNDVSQLHLNFSSGYAKKVVHITAGDEHRANFSLTNIASAKGLGIGYELEIPGSHSDVGGSYHQEEIEKKPMDEDMAHFVLQKGWFEQGDLKPHYDGTIVTRIGTRKVFGQYHKVGLAIMVDKANRYGKAGIPNGIFEVNTSKPDGKDVQEIQGRLREFAQNEANNVRWSIDSYKSESYAKWFRRWFLHFSAELPDIIGANKPAPNYKRKLIPG